MGLSMAACKALSVLGVSCENLSGRLVFDPSLAMCKKPSWYSDSVTQDNASSSVPSRLARA